jgi:hypothetical protein
MTTKGMGGRRKAVWGAAVTLGVTLAALSLVSCGDVPGEGEGSSYVIIQNLDGSSGATPDEFGNPIMSDVLTNQSIFNDLGRVQMRLVMRDPGTPGSPTAPTPNNFITVTRYRVVFIRADGRNTQGVDVPYGFDGQMATTLTDPNQTITVPFELVRQTAKVEAPLAGLRQSLIIIHAIAEITFYGHDQTGRETSVTGRVSINFGDFADPAS